MNRIRQYLVLLRVKHYIKNLLIFLPLIFSGNLLNCNLLFLTIIEFIAFCIAASSIYIFNDLKDYKKDMLHPIKKNRPIASGKVKKTEAYFLILALILTLILIQITLFLTNLLSISDFIYSTIILFCYIFINIIYSLYAKHIPILDLILLSLGFILRVYFGGSFVNIEISNWLYLTILSFSLYLVLGKRKGELKNNKDLSRNVLKYYTVDYLDKFMHIYLALTLAFYSLWCMNFSNNLLLYSIFIVIFIVMRYSLNIENNEKYLGDPVETLLHDKILLISVFVYALYVGVIIYGKNICI